mmetsp:Transcript_76154/g.88537  ORF Transcript_76154/g.88537 Transcript_76154/m.88537 type:complete len:84 (-) Transcript_76154:7-258(-)
MIQPFHNMPAIISSASLHPQPEMEMLQGGELQHTGPVDVMMELMMLTDRRDQAMKPLEVRILDGMHAQEKYLDRVVSVQHISE